jgi:menaquinone reductase, molybdopterin-binding-like subunit
MKVDRRSFLAFILGGAAGTALSPLPWKLTDDIAIWSQNWPWTPVPEKGEISHVNSTCQLCPGGCGITVRKSGERVVKIEGMPGHPVNQGGLCNLGAAGAQLLYWPTRVKTPLKKNNGRWQPISWEAGLAEVAAKLAELRANGMPHSVACICDSDRGTVAELLIRFFTAYGSPNFIRTSSIQDNCELTLYLTQGVRAMPGFDLENSDFVLSFGSGVLEGWQSPGYMFRAKSVLTEKGGRMNQFEPRLSKTAAKADKWIPINPGTDGVLALGLAHVMIKEQLYHQEFVEGYSSGFEMFKKRVIDDYPPETVSKITGVAADKIVALAGEFGRAAHPLAICGRGKGETPGSLQEFLAVHTLNALIGNINRPGGIWAISEPDYIDWPEVEIDKTAADGLQQARVDGAGGSNYPQARYLLNRLPEVINSSESSPVQLLFIAGVNPAYSTPNLPAMTAALEKIPMVVSFSSYMDETAAHADLILPNHFYLERYEDVPAALGYPQPIIGLVRPVIEPLYDTRHSGDVIIQLAQKMGDHFTKAFPWDDYGACLAATLGDKWNPLIREGFWLDPDFTAANWAEAFETDSTKFEFSNSDIAALPKDYPLRAEGDESFYPLLLVPYDSMRLTSGYIGTPPFLIKSLEDTILKGNDSLVEVNPQTAKELGLSDGKYAILSTPKGDARVKVHLFNGIMPGVIAMVRGLGHTAYDRFLARKGVNYNTLNGPLEDPATGFEAAWGIRAKLSKA